MVKRPEISEYNEYYEKYISLVPDGDILQILDEQMKETIRLLQDLTEAEGQFRYSPEKWSLKEVLGHIADTERVMGYRLLTFGRGETASLPGYDIDGYVSNAVFDEQPVQDLLDNLHSVRQSTLQLLKSFTEEAWLRGGIASNFEVTVRALVYIVAGHELHHRQIIQEHYLK
ncbi:DinB family protein [Bacillus gobiensis]|uniref:DinB family protein n=1 Tax=Bacillus gobiensis TaxID=1441095 RepID=UPI003D223761